MVKFLGKLEDKKDCNVIESITFLKRGKKYLVRYHSSHEDGCCDLTGFYECTHCPYYNYKECTNNEWVEVEYFHPEYKQTIRRRAVPASEWDLKIAREAGLIK